VKLVAGRYQPIVSNVTGMRSFSVRLERITDMPSLSNKAPDV
jgi:hypothetical protein